jgi:hypothetical protein
MAFRGKMSIPSVKLPSMKKNLMKMKALLEIILLS